MLLRTLEASLLGNMLAGKGMLRDGCGSSVKISFDSTPSFNNFLNTEI